jgi:serine protease Do
MKRIARRDWLALAGFWICSLLAVMPAALAAEGDGAPSSKLQMIFAGASPSSVDDLKAMQERLQTLVEKVSPSTVAIRVGPAQGTGVIISEDGYVLTAAHVGGRPNRDVTFVLPDGRIVKGKTLGLNRGIDAGLMKIDGEGPWPYMEMGTSDQVRPGQWCLAMGHPGGYQSGRRPVLRFGRVLSVDKNLIMTDCALVGGDSGGPLFDMDGKVIAIHSRIGNPLTVNIHVPVNTYRETWDRLVKAEQWGLFPGSSPYIGVRGDPNVNSAQISEVFPNTPAERAGVKIGDVIVKFDGQSVDDFAALSAMVGERQPGEKIELEIRRGERTIVLELVIGQRSD